MPPLPENAGSDGPEVLAPAPGQRKPGRYVSATLGLASPVFADASWRPPGYPADPEVFFDLDGDASGYTAVAVGRDFGNGFRGEVSFNIFGKSDFDGPWSRTVPPTPGPHAEVRGSVSSVALMANGYYDVNNAFPANSRIRPYFTAGIGVAHNRMSDWTRINPDAGRTERSFRGASRSDLAWSVGFGLSTDLKQTIAGAPAVLDIGYRYFDLGEARGSRDPLPGSGAGGRPERALGFHRREHVVTVGLRLVF